MRPSIAQRESLVTPGNLAIMLGLFAVAFWVLKPTAAPGVSQLVSEGTNSAPDQLDLAYLKAEKSVGGTTDADVVRVFTILLRSGKLENARILLADHPSLEMDEALRFELELEMAAIDSPFAVQGLLQTFVDTPGLHSPHLLKRSTKLSLDAPQLETSLALFRLSAKSALPDTNKTSALYQQCGDYMSANAIPHMAITCYREGLEIAQRQEHQFSLRIALLPLLDVSDPARSILLDTLLDDAEASTAQSTELATVLLGVERPDLAFRIYARMALADPEGGEVWLPEAARWAQAAGKPADAAVFLEALAGFKTGGEKRDLEVRVEELLIAAGRSQEAYARMKRRINLDSTDLDALRQGIVFARQLGDPQQALAWNSLLLMQFPEDMDVLTLQRELALASGDLAQSREVGQRLLENSPNDMGTRRRLAQVSEWDGAPLEALDHWLAFAAERRQLETDEHLHALREIVRLGELTLQPAIAVQALRELTLISTPTLDDSNHLLSLYELDGRPEEGSIALQDILTLHGPQPPLYRILASHEYRHKRFQESLNAWRAYEKHAGATAEAILAQMELLWRLDRKGLAAKKAGHLRGHGYLSQASDYQLRLMAEISWRYRLPWLALGVQPRLDSIEADDQRLLFSRRSLDVLQQDGKDQLAITESLKLWESTNNPDFALLAMQLAVKIDSQPVLEQFSPQSPDAKSLKVRPVYWNQLAAIRLRAGNIKGARDAFDQALKLDRGNTESMAGLIWLAIGADEQAELHDALRAYKSQALIAPELWQAMAVGYLQLGAASSSIFWFDKLLAQVETDYGMLLTYADALEYAGRSAMARNVRQYTLQQLRPLLASGTQREQNLLLRQYMRLSSRYATVESNERLFDHLLTKDSDNPLYKVSLNNRTALEVIGAGTATDNDKKISPIDPDGLWREEMAISWLMSTQQFEHARLVMGRLHELRMQTPAWQRLALALKDNDQQTLQALIGAQGSLSIGNHILALRQVGREREAYAMARHALVPGARYPGFGVYDRRVVEDQFVSLRSLRPSYISGGVNTRYVGGLTIKDSSVNVRHSLLHSDMGFSLALRQRQLNSDEYQLDGLDEFSDIALSLHFGNSQRGGYLTTGLQSAENDNIGYGAGRYVLRHREGKNSATAEFAYNESVNYSPELLIAGAQHRFTLGYDIEFAQRNFINFRANATDINTRVERRKVAQGLGGSVELGVRGAFGNNTWTTSAQAGMQSHDREAELPDELSLSENSSLDGILAKKEKSLSFGGSLSRGSTVSGFPQVSSPRYYINARVGQSWPQNVLGLQLNAGAGIRVLGGDELSFSVAHDTQPTTQNSNESTSVGMHYRYHFQ